MDGLVNRDKKHNREGGSLDSVLEAPNVVMDDCGASEALIETSGQPEDIMGREKGAVTKEAITRASGVLYDGWFELIKIRSLAKAGFFASHTEMEEQLDHDEFGDLFRIIETLANRVLDLLDEAMERSA